MPGSLWPLRKRGRGPAGRHGSEQGSLQAAHAQGGLRLWELGGWMEAAAGTAGPFSERLLRAPHPREAFPFLAEKAQDRSVLRQR